MLNRKAKTNPNTPSQLKQIVKPAPKAQDVAKKNGHVYQSKIDDNSWSPSGYPDGWTDLGTIEEVQQGATS